MWYCAYVSSNKPVYCLGKVGFVYTISSPPLNFVSAISCFSPLLGKKSKLCT